MSSFIEGWRCDHCGGKVRLTDSEEQKNYVYIYCDYAPCLNSPAQRGGDHMRRTYYQRGFTPNWIRQ